MSYDQGWHFTQVKKNTHTTKWVILGGLDQLIFSQHNSQPKQNLTLRLLKTHIAAKYWADKIFMIFPCVSLIYILKNRNNTG